MPQYSVEYVVVSHLVPQKVELKKSKSCAKYMAEVSQKIGKVAPKLRANLHIF